MREKIKFFIITLFTFSSSVVFGAGDELYGDYTTRKNSSETTPKDNVTSSSFSNEEYYPGMFEQELALDGGLDESRTTNGTVQSNVTLVVTPSWYGAGWDMGFAPSWYYSSYVNPWYTPWYDPWYYHNSYYGWGRPFYSYPYPPYSWGYPHYRPYYYPHYGYHRPVKPRRVTNYVRGDKSSTHYRGERTNRVNNRLHQDVVNKSNNDNNNRTYNGKTTSTRQPVQNNARSGSVMPRQSTPSRSRTPIATGRRR